MFEYLYMLLNEAGHVFLKTARPKQPTAKKIDLSRPRDKNAVRSRKHDF